MLQEVCEYIHNYFIKEPKSGTYTISGGMISPADFLQEGQRFLISGSVFNDGIHTYHSSGIMDDDDSNAEPLTDEEFTGVVCGLSIPMSVVKLSGEIADWVEANKDVLNSPYQSESFGGYSYTKASGISGGGGKQDSGWQAQFGSRLNRWRKVSF